MLSSEFHCCVNDIVVGWIDGALGDMLRNKIEVGPLLSRYYSVNDCTTRWIRQTPVGFIKEPSVAALFDDDHTQEGSVGAVYHRECLLDLWYLMLFNL